MSVFRCACCVLALGMTVASGCGSSTTTKSVGGKQIGGGSSAPAASSNLPPADPQPNPPAPASGGSGAGSSEPNSITPESSADSAVASAVPGRASDPSANNAQAGDLPASSSPVVRSRDLFSGDVEPHRLSGKFQTVVSQELAGARMVVDSEVPNVDSMSIEEVEPGTDSSRFVVGESQFADPLWMHHPTIRHAVTGSADDYDLPEGLTPIEAAGHTEDGFPWRVQCDADGSIMGLVPAGPSTMGCNSGPDNCQPQLTVVLEGFYIDLHEITVAQYRRARSGDKSDKKPVGRPASANVPVAGLLWSEARSYAQWAGKDLPTEAEWEKAARGADGFAHPWGEGIPIWPQQRRPGEITPVGQFPADLSPFGLYDTAGNVREWVLDWYLDDAFAKLAADSRGALRNPVGPRSQGTTNQRVVKGGSPDWLLYVRAGVAGNQRPDDVGFRCVARLKPRAKGKK